MENKSQKVNPRQYVYEQGTKVEVEGFFISDMILLLDKLVNDEIRPESRFKYNFVNESGKILKSPKKEDVESGKVKKILDIDRTIINPTMEYSISEKGIQYAELKNFLEALHFENIKKGVAVSYESLVQKAHAEANTEEKEG